LNAAIATFALKAGEWFWRTRFAMSAPCGGLFRPLDEQSRHLADRPVMRGHLSEAAPAGNETRSDLPKIT
jgi:hypothetical protein